jgi:putative transposase
MSQSATVRSVRRAGRVIKRLMNHSPEGWSSLEEAGRDGIRRALEERMQWRLRSFLEQQLSAGQQDRRNGFYRRHLLTALGDIELEVPRTRHFSAVEMVQRFARRSPSIDRSILACFVLGLSTRKVAEALLPILGERISASTVSRVAQSLDAAVQAYHGRPLSNRYEQLLLDGVVLTRRTGASGVLRKPVLVALGILPNQKKEIIDFLLAPAESQVAWEGFLHDLYRRGLTGEGLKVVTIDGCPGLAGALQVVYPRIPLQRCWAHKVRNILDKVRKADWEAVKRSLRRIYQARNRMNALRAVLLFGAAWEKRYPKAVRCLTRDLEELLTFFLFNDPDQRRQARTTNAIERRFREVRRRTRPMGVFSDRTSIERILFAVFTYENQRQGTGTPFLLTHKS